MNPALWVAKTGLDAQQTRMQVVSNNLANANTTGFKKDRAVFEDLLYQNVRQAGGQSTQQTRLPTGMHLGTGVRVAASEKIHQQGTVSQTGNSLDVAIDGRGFFQIRLPDGTAAYTRDGNFELDDQGQLVTSSGYVVEPGITVPQGAQSVTIGSDGTVSVKMNGEAAAAQIGSLQLTDFTNAAGLMPRGANLYVETAASGAPQTGTPGLNGIGTIQQGALEASNVNVVEELVNMIETQRAYEMNSKAISTTDQMLQYLTNNGRVHGASRTARRGRGGHGEKRHEQHAVARHRRRSAAPAGRLRTQPPGGRRRSVVAAGGAAGGAAERGHAGCHLPVRAGTEPVRGPARHAGRRHRHHLPGRAHRRQQAVLHQHRQGQQPDHSGHRHHRRQGAAASGDRPEVGAGLQRQGQQQPEQPPQRQHHGDGGRGHGQRQPARGRREVGHAQPGRGVHPPRRCHPAHRHRARQQPAVVEGGRCPHHLQRQGRAQRCQRHGLARPRLPVTAVTVLTARRRFDSHELPFPEQSQGPGADRRRRPAHAARAGAGRARQGPGQHLRRARQPAGRLRPGGRPRRHRRPDQPGPVHHPEHPQHAVALRRQGAGQHQPAAQERGRGHGPRHAAAVRQARPEYRCHRVLDRQRRLAARRQPADDAADRRRRPDLRHGPGQPAGRRHGRLRPGRLAHHRQRAQRRPHSRRRQRRATGAGPGRGQRPDTAQPQQPGFHHRQPPGRGDQPQPRRGRGARHGRHHGGGAGAGRPGPPDQLHLHSREHGDQAGRGARARGGELPHRHHRHRRHRAHAAGGGDPRLAHRDHQGKPARQPAGAVLAGPDRHRAGLHHRGGAGDAAHVQARHRQHAG
ncbi:UNVERIFIED_CONTAM: flgG [Trichonephila clavipes]